MALNYSSIEDDGAFSFRNLERFDVFIILLLTHNKIDIINSILYIHQTTNFFRYLLQ